MFKTGTLNFYTFFGSNVSQTVFLQITTPTLISRKTFGSKLSCKLTSPKGIGGGKIQLSYSIHRPFEKDMRINCLGRRKNSACKGQTISFAEEVRAKQPHWSNCLTFSGPGTHKYATWSCFQSVQGKPEIQSRISKSKCT
jgi:hypothetical protein